MIYKIIINVLSLFNPKILISGLNIDEKKLIILIDNN